MYTRKVLLAASICAPARAQQPRAAAYIIANLRLGLEQKPRN